MAEFYKWYTDQRQDEEEGSSVFFVADKVHSFWHNYLGVDVWLDENGQVVDVFVTYNFTNPTEWDKDSISKPATTEQIKKIWNQAWDYMPTIFHQIFIKMP